VDLNQITLPCLNIDVTIEFFRKMGFRAIVVDEHYARFESLEGDATFSIHKVEKTHETNVIIYFECKNLDAKVSELTEKGFQFESQVTDQPWLWREAMLRDPSGNQICLYYAGENRKNPPWRTKD